MPCYDPPDLFFEEEETHNDELNKIESILCSLLYACKAFSTKDNYELIISYAQKLTNSDIRQWIKEHEKNDANRIKNKISKEFNEKDLDILKTLIRSGEL